MCMMLQRLSELGPALEEIGIQWHWPVANFAVPSNPELLTCAFAHTSDLATLDGAFIWFSLCYIGFLINLHYFHRKQALNMQAC